jgi:hypothetical protein
VSDLQHFLPHQHPAFGTRNHDANARSKTSEEPEGGTLNGYIIVGQTKVHVQENLERALQYLRRPALERTLWIDAICIDQENDLERGHQVSQMGRIYQLASSVYVWLGGASHYSNQALQFVRDLWRVKTINGVLQDDVQSEWTVFKENFLTCGCFSNERLIQLHALGYLVNRTWFYRRWVVQEVAFASDIIVQCGESTAPWSEFANAIAFLHNHHPKLERILRTFHPNDDWILLSPMDSQSPNPTPDIQARAASQFLFITRSLLLKNSENHILSRMVDINIMVTKLWALRVTDPRDTIYAFFSLARDASNSSDLYPNYRKSACEVFVDFVKYAIISTNSLDIILQPWASPCRIKMPSWIRTNETASEFGLLFQSDQVDGVEHNGSQSSIYYAASAQSHPSFEIHHINSTYMLKAEGFTVAQIVELKDVAHQGNVHTNWRPVKGWSQFWHVVIGGRTLTGGKPPPSYEFICWNVFKGWEIQLGGGYGARTSVSEINIKHLIDVFHGSDNHNILPKPFLAEFSQSEHTLPFLERLRSCARNRRLVRTSDGKLGLAPAHTNYGDIVCILMGCSLPVILRPVGTKFLVIGEAYIYGISDGEAMSDLKKGKYRLQDLWLL